MSKYQASLEMADSPLLPSGLTDTGDAPTSYQVPTRSAVKGVFESILWLPTVVVVPTGVEVLHPIVYHTYTTNYGGPLRKSGTANFQLIATVLINVCYRFYADLRPFDGPSDGLQPQPGPGSVRTVLMPIRKCLKKGSNAVSGLVLLASGGRSLCLTTWVHSEPGRRRCKRI